MVDKWQGLTEKDLGFRKPKFCIKKQKQHRLARAFVFFIFLVLNLTTFKIAMKTFIPLSCDSAPQGVDKQK